MKLREYVKQIPVIAMNERNKKRKHPVAERVMKSVRGGACTGGDVARELGITTASACAALYRLQKRGKVRLVHRWEVVE